MPKRGIELENLHTHKKLYRIRWVVPYQKLSPLGRLENTQNKLKKESLRPLQYPYRADSCSISYKSRDFI